MDTDAPILSGVIVARTSIDPSYSIVSETGDPFPGSYPFKVNINFGIWNPDIDENV